MKYNELTISAARIALDNGEVSALDLTKDCLAAIKHSDKKINACLAIDEAGALEAARLADARLKAGERRALLGIPFLAKDNIMTKGIVTTAASKILEDYVAPYDATIIARLKKEGAILLGKTNLDEFAHGASTEFSAFGVTKNPWDLKRVSGGSSGGSAAAVAADFCLFALGTDTGGSVRHPAAFCGVVGLKPSYGRASRFGLIAMTSSTDVPGCLTKSVEDAALVLRAIAGHDDYDATSLDAAIPHYAENLSDFSWKNITIGIPEEISAFPLASAAKKSFEKIKEEIRRAGAKIIPISLPSLEYALAAYYVLTPSEISSNLARFDGIRFGKSAATEKNIAKAYEEAREAGFGPEVKRRIILGTYCLSSGYYDAYYVRAQKVRTRVIEDFNKVFKRCNFIMTPATPGPAFALNTKTKDPLQMYLEDVFLVPANLAGLPAISIPAAKKPLPTGLHLMAPMLAEQELLAAAKACEALTIDRLLKPSL